MWRPSCVVRDGIGSCTAKIAAVAFRLVYLQPVGIACKCDTSDSHWRASSVSSSQYDLSTADAAYYWAILHCNTCDYLSVHVGSSAAVVGAHVQYQLVNYTKMQISTFGLPKVTAWNRLFSEVATRRTH
eukprot:6182036-Pleurochrysis_carterae.AAC.1